MDVFCRKRFDHLYAIALWFGLRPYVQWTGTRFPFQLPYKVLWGQPSISLFFQCFVSFIPWLMCHLSTYKFNIRVIYHTTTRSKFLTFFNVSLLSTNEPNTSVLVLDSMHLRFEMTCLLTFALLHHWCHCGIDWRHIFLEKPILFGNLHIPVVLRDAMSLIHSFLQSLLF